MTYAKADERLLEVERWSHVYRRRFKLAALGYAILALGTLVALLLVVSQINNLRDTNEHVAAAAGAFCEAGLAPDAQEPSVLMRIAVAKEIENPIDAAKHPVCRDIIRRLLESNN